jgi:branched-chain amino acid transport system ATP-binding protein
LNAELIDTRHAQATSGKDPVLSLRSVSAGYNQANVLNDLNIEVRSGECVAVLGPNGVGKTTIMRTIAGLLHPRIGTIEWQGTTLNALPPHQIVELGVAMVPEGRRLYGGMTVHENLLMGAYSAPLREAKQRVEVIYQTFDLLRERSNQLAGTMSGGQQQLCAIGRALMSKPKLLLVDELSLGLSPAAIKQVIAAMQTAIRMFQPTILVVDQDVNVAAALASRGYFIDRGTVVGSGLMSELVNVDLVRKLYFQPVKPKS